MGWWGWWRLLPSHSGGAVLRYGPLLDAVLVHRPSELLGSAAGKVARWVLPASHPKQVPGSRAAGVCLGCGAGSRRGRRVGSTTIWKQGECLGEVVRWAVGGWDRLSIG
ncbi:hypothetical protein FKM82_019071 [Ascaphus truei]